MFTKDLLILNKMSIYLQDKPQSFECYFVKRKTVLKMYFRKVSYFVVFDLPLDSPPFELWLSCKKFGFKINWKVIQLNSIVENIMKT